MIPMKNASIAIGISVFVWALIAVHSAVADSIRVGKLRYNDVTVEDAYDGKLFFRTGKMPVSKPLGEVDFITLQDQGDFNRAEMLRSSQDNVTALTAYTAAMEKDVPAWQKRLIRYRRLPLLNHQAMVDRAAVDWILLMLDSQESSPLRSFAPTNFPPKGTPSNAVAIRFLQSSLAGLNASQKTAVQEVLVELCFLEGRVLEASEIAKELEKNSPASRPASPVSLADARMDELQKWIEAGRAEEALEELKPRIRSMKYATKDMPRAGYLAGLANRKLSEMAEGHVQKQYLISAGLDFMRVVAFYGDSEWAPRALLQAAEVNRDLGNPQAAINACRELMEKYPNDSTVESAKALLQVLSSAGTIEP